MMDQKSSAASNIGSYQLDMTGSLTQDLGLDLPVKFDRTTIVRTFRSHFPSMEIEHRFKDLIINAFSSHKLLSKVC